MVQRAPESAVEAFTAVVGESHTSLGAAGGLFCLVAGLQSVVELWCIKCSPLHQCTSTLGSAHLPSVGSLRVGKRCWGSLSIHSASGWVMGVPYFANLFLVALSMEGVKA